MRVNVFGPAWTVQFLVEHDLLAVDARVLNISSGLGSMHASLSMTPRICLGYSISKASLNMLTVHQSGDLRRTLPNVVVIAVDPGWAKTRMGGTAAPLDPHVSVAGMINMMRNLTDSDNGGFFSYDGSKTPW